MSKYNKMKKSELIEALTKMEEDNINLKTAREEDEDVYPSPSEEMSNIRETMFALLDRAYSLLPEREKPAARGYWYGQIKSALGSTSYSTYSTTMHDSLKVLQDEEGIPAPDLD